VQVFSQTPSVSAASAYTAGDAVGGKLTFSGVPVTGKIQGITFIDLDEEGPEFDVVFFGADFTATADNAAFDITAGEEANLIGTVNIASADFKDLGGLKVATKAGVNLPYQLASSTGSRIYAQLVTRGTPTYTATTDVTVKIAVGKADE
jgi:hypothetical protein